MLAETPTEAFNINSLFVDSRQIVERSTEPKLNHLISKKECRELYPHHDGVDGESFYRLIVRFHDRHFAEKLISLCNFDFSLATRLGTLCHGNVFLLKRLCLLFSNDLSSALRFFDCFSSSLSSSSPFLLSSQFLSCFGNDVFSASSFLSHFDDDYSSASSFLALFKNDGSSASSFLASFNNDFAQANAALDQKTHSKFSEESSFELALRGCNGDISVVETFSRLSGIKHLELLFDSEQHPRTGQAFHSRCDGRGPTVAFFCSSGNCVCGVVNSSWMTPPGSEGKWVSDSSAYLLRLSPDPRKFPIKSDEKANALYCRSDLGPCFGAGCDLGTGFSNDMKNYPKGMYSFVRSGRSYDLPANGFLFSKSEGTGYPIDRIVVCKYTQ